jgi:hypothetical protein
LFHDVGSSREHGQNLPSSLIRIFFPQAQLSKELEDYISTNRKTICSLSNIDKDAIQIFIEAPAKDITLIKTILPKIEKFEKMVCPKY